MACSRRQESGIWRVRYVEGGGGLRGGSYCCCVALRRCAVLPIVSFAQGWCTVVGLSRYEQRCLFLLRSARKCFVLMAYVVVGLFVSSIMRFVPTFAVDNQFDEWSSMFCVDGVGFVVGLFAQTVRDVPSSVVDNHLDYCPAVLILRPFPCSIPGGCPLGPPFYLVTSFVFIFVVAVAAVFEIACPWARGNNNEQTHQEKLEVDSPCQIFLQSEGQWVDAVVLSIENGPNNTPAVATNNRRWVGKKKGGGTGRAQGDEVLFYFIVIVLLRGPELDARLLITRFWFSRRCSHGGIYGYMPDRSFL